MILPDKVPMAIFVCPPSNCLQKMAIIIQVISRGKEGGRKGRRKEKEEEGKGKGEKVVPNLSKAWFLLQWMEQS